MIITDKIMAQILDIRAVGNHNMFLARDVQREANEKGYHELVLLIEDSKKDYCNFILTGERG